LGGLQESWEGLGEVLGGLGALLSAQNEFKDGPKSTPQTNSSK